jgi:uncharacterized membrane protein YhhN
LFCFAGAFQYLSIQETQAQLKPKSILFFSIFYFIILGIEIFAEHQYKITGDFTFLAIMQPLVVPGLIAYLVYNCRGKFNSLTMGVLVALCFDWVSDVVLTIYKDAFNLPCMFGYFAGHVCYAIAFTSGNKKNGYKVSLISRIFFVLPPLFYVVVYYFFLYDYVSTHEVKNIYILPIALYSLSILAMATSALWRMGTTSDTSFWCITAGALFYLLSDSVSGYDHFVAPVPLRYLASMFAYGAALLLFTIGSILHRPST